ncbi:MAG: hypothetical protein JW791_04945 [Nanoarchaeota archaeon]|nr:hypothetical protein [Nanoarchaeota archaeon]
MVNKLVLKSSKNSVFGYLNDLDDFVEIVPTLPENVLNFHINKTKNDFLKWLSKEFSLSLNIDKFESNIEIAAKMSFQVKTFLENQRLEIIEVLPKNIEALEKIILNKNIQQKDSIMNKFFNFIRKKN